jgi:hypothetical protein
MAATQWTTVKEIVIGIETGTEIGIETGIVTAIRCANVSPNVKSSANMSARLSVSRNAIVNENANMSVTNITVTMVMMANRTGSARISPAG